MKERTTAAILPRGEGKKKGGRVGVKFAQTNKANGSPASP